MKDRFLEISSIRKQIQELLHRLEDKKKGMKENYSTLVTSNDNHFFGLDSFRFQVKLAENELAFLNDQFVLIDNRLYCDYYKLYNHVYDYYLENLPPGIVKSVFPIYKDLEPTKVYETELVHKLYKDILTLIHKAYDTLEHEHRKRESEKRLTTSGIHIGNYVHNRVFTDTLIKTNIELFEQYLNTYFIYHMTFLVNLKERLGMFLDHVLRRQPVEQGCHVDELDDNFVGIVRDETEPVVVETFHSIAEDAKPEPEEKSETKSESTEPEAVEAPVEEPETNSESPVVEDPIEEEPETKTDGPVVEDPAEEEPETKTDAPEVPVEESPEPISEAGSPIESAEAQVEESETISETKTDSPEESEALVETLAEPNIPEKALTAEEVLNPIIEHILKHVNTKTEPSEEATQEATQEPTQEPTQEATQPLMEPAKKKKRPRKK